MGHTKDTKSGAKIGAKKIKNRKRGKKWEAKLEKM